MARKGAGRDRVALVLAVGLCIVLVALAVCVFWVATGTTDGNVASASATTVLGVMLGGTLSALATYLGVWETDHDDDDDDEEKR